MLSNQDVQDAKADEDDARAKLEKLQDELQSLSQKKGLDPTERAIAQASLSRRISAAQEVWQNARSYRISLRRELYVC